MKKILFITAFPPCQKTAGQDYSRRLLLDLVKRGIKVSLIYTEYPGHIPEIIDDIDILKIIKPSLKNCVLKLPIHPFFTKRFNNETLCFIKSIASDYDILYFDFSQIHLYSLYINHPNKILMCHDVIAQKYYRKGKLQLPFIKKTELKILKSAKNIITFSSKDSDFIKEKYNLTSTNVNFYLKNGAFIYSDSINSNNHFCFYGAWNRKENTEALEWFFKRVYKKVRKDIIYDIIGGGLPNKLKRRLLRNQNINYLGFVDDPVKTVANCQALIAPLHKGAGVKVKVIDAISSGTAVIGTDVALEGIEDNLVNHVLIKAIKPDDYIKTLNNWKLISVREKQLAANEFFERYDKNHFSDIIEHL